MIKHMSLHVNTSFLIHVAEINDGPTKKYIKVREILSKSCMLLRDDYSHPDAITKLKFRRIIFITPIFPKPDTWTHHLLMNLSP